MTFVYKKEIGCCVYYPLLVQRYDLQGEMLKQRFVECQESLTLLFNRWVVENKKKSAVPGAGRIVHWQLVDIFDTIGLPFAVGYEYLTRLGLL